jgi:hypothetical protein
MYEEEFIGAIKIKDGLFIGDEASVRVTTTEDNKKRIIN